MDFQALFEGAGVPVVVCGALGLNVVFASKEARELFGENREAGYSAEELFCGFIGAKALRALLGEADEKNAAEAFFEQNGRVLIKGARGVKVRVNRAAADAAYYVFYITPVCLNSETSGFLNAMSSIIDNIDALVFVTHIKTNKVIYMNSSMARERGVKDKEREELFCYQMFMRDIDAPCPDCPNKVMLDEAGMPNGVVLRSEFQSTINNKWYSTTTTAVEWLNGECAFLYSAVEITERKQSEYMLQKSATTDAMTGVYNREYGYKVLDRLIADSAGSDVSSSAAFLDIDGLKFVNDNYGHIEGDKIIVGVVDALKKSTRKNDCLFRWGGDEFVILLPGCPKDIAEHVMKNALALLGDVNKISEKPYKYSFSYGVHEIKPQTRETAEVVLKAADTRMYEQKKSKAARPAKPLSV